MTLLQHGLMTINQFLGFTVIFMLCIGIWGESLNILEVVDSTGAKENIEHYRNYVLLSSIVVAIGIFILLQQMATYIWFFTR